MHPHLQIPEVYTLYFLIPVVSEKKQRLKERMDACIDNLFRLIYCLNSRLQCRLLQFLRRLEGANCLFGIHSVWTTQFF